MEQIAEQIRQQIMWRQYTAMKQVKSSTSGSQQYAGAWNLMVALFHIEDFQFDSATHKFMFIVSPKPYQETMVIQAVLGQAYVDLKNIQFTLSTGNMYSSTQQECLANIFGGEVSMNTWSSEFELEVGKLDFFGNQNGDQYPLAALREKNTAASTDEYYRGMSQLITTLNAYSRNVSKPWTDNYVYLRGAPEASFWNTDGTVSDFAALLPRNRPYGQQVSFDSAYLTEKTLSVKTSLNSLRVMRLQLTDKDGNPVEFEDEFVIKFAVRFDIK